MTNNTKFIIFGNFWKIQQPHIESAVSYLKNQTKFSRSSLRILFVLYYNDEAQVESSQTTEQYVGALYGIYDSVGVKPLALSMGDAIDILTNSDMNVQEVMVYSSDLTELQDLLCVASDLNIGIKVHKTHSQNNGKNNGTNRTKRGAMSKNWNDFSL